MIKNNIKKGFIQGVFLVLAFVPFTTFSKGVEIFQIIAFSWDETQKKLEVFSNGSGTAIGSDLVLTNKHVILGKKGMADLVLLCQGSEKSTKSVSCDIPAGVVSVHEKLDAALIKPLSSSAFLPSMRTSSLRRIKGDKIVIKGFPVPLGESHQNFGNTKTYQKIKDWGKNGGKLKIGGDSITTTKGSIMAAGTLSSTGGEYYISNAKVNFGNSGGATLDVHGNFIGIPTFKDKDSNAYILAYRQLAPWVRKMKSAKTAVKPEVLLAFEKISGQSVKKKVFRRGSLSRESVRKTRTKTTKKRRYTLPSKTKKRTASRRFMYSRYNRTRR